MSFDFSANFAYTGTSQLWTKPINVNTAYLYANGAGGAGNSNNASGGGGAYTLSIYRYLQADLSYNVIVNVGSGGQAPPLQAGGISVGGYIDSSGNSQNSGGAGTTLSGISSGGGGGMTTILYTDPSGINIFKIIAGGGGGGGKLSSTNGGASGNIGTPVLNNSASSSIGSTGLGAGGGQGGNSDLSGNAGIGGINGGVNGHDYIDISGIYNTYYGGGGGSGGTFAGGGGGAGYGGAAGGKYGGGGGGGSYSNANTSLFSVGAGGAGGGPGQNGGDGTVTIYWYEVPPVIPQPEVKMFMLNAQHTVKSSYTAPIRVPAIVRDLSFSALGSSNPNSAVINSRGVIYVIGGNGALYAFNYNFTQKWLNPFSISGYPFFGTPSITADGTLYVSSTTALATKYFFAVVDNGLNGGQKWAYPLDLPDGNISTSPVLDLSNNIFFGTDQGIIYAIRDGTIQGIKGWQYPSNNLGSLPTVGTSIIGAPAIDLSYNILCYTTNSNITLNSTINALDLSGNSVLNQITPTLRWSKTGIVANEYYTAPSLGTSSSINNMIAYTSSSAGNIYAFDISNNGNSIWTAPINIADTNLSTIAIGQDNHIYLTSKNSLNVIDSSNGFLEWTYPIIPMGATNVLNNSIPLIDACNNILFGARDNHLYSIDGIGRNFNWRYGVGAPIQAMPVLGANNHIFVGANNATFYDLCGNSAPVPTTTAVVPMYMLNTRHTSLSNYYGPTTTTLPSIYWQQPFVSGNLYVSPSISIASDGTLYLGSNDGYVYALDSTNGGAIKWINQISNSSSGNYNSPNAIFTTPVVAPDKTIYIGSNQGYLYALNPTGTIKWSYNAGYPLQSSPIIDASGSIYFGASKYVFAVGDDGFSAYPKWLTPFQTNANVNSSPALGSNGYLYFGSDDGYVYAIEHFTGLLKWSTNLSIILPPGVYVDPIYTSASVDASCNVIIGNGSYMNGSLYYLDGSNGNILWTKIPTDFISSKVGPIYNTVAIHGDTLYLSTIGYFYALDRVTGATKWHFYDKNCYYTSATIDASGTIFFCSIKAADDFQYTKNAGILHSLTDNGSSFKENWALQVCSPGRLAPPVIGLDRTIYISATANKIYAIK